MEDRDYMRIALEEAVKGEGWTNPNPMVGAVIVKDGRIIGRGYHRRYGELHAERNAITHCQESMEGATIYVTLEPCAITGSSRPVRRRSSGRDFPGWSSVRMIRTLSSPERGSEC